MAPEDEQAPYDYSEGEPNDGDNGSYSSDANDPVEVALAPTESEAEGESTTKEVHDRSEIRYYRMTMASSVWFMIASVMYLWLAIITFQYYDQLKGVPAWVQAADDDYSWYGYWEDDYVFQAKGQWVSRYMIVYFIAALGYVFTGILDFIKEPGFVGILFILAGGFGLASAICTDVNERLAVIFNMISVHLFMLEAIGLLFRRSFFGGVEIWLRTSDSFFLIGSLIDVAISYTLLFDAFNLTLAVLGIVASCLWVCTALIYVGSTYYIQHHTGFEGAMHGEKATVVEVESDEQDFDETEEKGMDATEEQDMVEVEPANDKV